MLLGQVKLGYRLKNCQGQQKAMLSSVCKEEKKDRYIDWGMQQNVNRCHRKNRLLNSCFDSMVSIRKNDLQTEEGQSKQRVNWGPR